MSDIFKENMKEYLKEILKGVCVRILAGISGGIAVWMSESNNVRIILGLSTAFF